MANSTLSKGQARSLLDKLAADDAFRSLFATDRKAALLQVGLDEATIAQLPSSCLQPKQLASKDEYVRILKESTDEAVTAASQMTVPQVGFTS